MSALRDGNAVLWPTPWLKFSTGFQRLDILTPPAKKGVFQHYPDNADFGKRRQCMRNENGKNLSMVTVRTS